MIWRLPDLLLRYHGPEDPLQTFQPIGYLAFALTSALSAQTHTTWRDYSGSPDAAQYSALKQIDSSNVTQLEVAWTYPVGDDKHYFFNPIVIDRTMYVLAKNNSIVALGPFKNRSRNARGVQAAGEGGSSFPPYCSGVAWPT